MRLDFQFLSVAMVALFLSGCAEGPYKGGVSPSQSYSTSSRYSQAGYQGHELSAESRTMNPPSPAYHGSQLSSVSTRETQLYNGQMIQGQ